MYFYPGQRLVYFIQHPAGDNRKVFGDNGRGNFAYLEAALQWVIENAAAYNVVAVSFAVTGYMHPLLAAVLMPLSSITVVVSSYRARTFEPRDG